MKRQGNLLSFAFFGFLAEAVLLALLNQWNFLEQVFGFLLAGNGFLFYRVYIRQKKQGMQESYVKKEMRRWWLRQEPENTFSFALVGGMLLVLCNFGLWQNFRLIDVWAMGFVAVGLSQIGFEQARQLFNRIYAYLSEKRRAKNLAEVKTGHGHGLHEVAHQGSG